MDTKNQYTPSYPTQEGNYGQMRFVPVESDASAHEGKKLRQKMKKVRHETEEMRRETEEMRREMAMMRYDMEILHQNQDKIVRYLEHLLMRLSANEVGVFDCDIIAMQLGLSPSVHKKSDNTIFDRIKRSR